MIPNCSGRTEALFLMTPTLTSIPALQIHTRTFPYRKRDPSCSDQAQATIRTHRCPAMQDTRQGNSQDERACDPCRQCDRREKFSSTGSYVFINTTNLRTIKPAANPYSIKLSGYLPSSILSNNKMTALDSNRCLVLYLTQSRPTGFAKARISLSARRQKAHRHAFPHGTCFSVSPSSRRSPVFILFLFPGRCIIARGSAAWPGRRRRGVPKPIGHISAIKPSRFGPELVFSQSHSIISDVFIARRRPSC